MGGTRSISDKRIVKADFVRKCVANRTVAFKFFSDDDFEQRPRGCI